MSKVPRRPSSPRPSPAVHLDARSLRGIAHPLRVRILEMLRAEGPSTATRLAERLRLASGATSYHLRQLAAYGFVVEDETRGSPRERWWRAAHQGTNFRAADFGPEAAELSEAYLRAVGALYAEQMHRAIDEWPTLSAVWQRSGTLSDVQLRLTPEEMRRLCDEIFEVTRRYRRDDPEQVAQAPPGSERVVVQVQAFRRPGRPADEAE